MDTRSDEEEILARNDEMLTGLVDSDTDALDRLLAPDFVAVHITGQQQGRDDWLAQIRARRMEYHDVERLTAHVAVDGDSAVLVTRNRVLATIWGARGRWSLESTTTYVRRAGTWLISRSAATTF